MTIRQLAQKFETMLNQLEKWKAWPKAGGSAKEIRACEKGCIAQKVLMKVSAEKNKGKFTTTWPDALANEFIKTANLKGLESEKEKDPYGYGPRETNKRRKKFFDAIEKIAAAYDDAELSRPDDDMGIFRTGLPTARHRRTLRNAIARLAKV
jgi:hypothetical protein